MYQFCNVSKFIKISNINNYCLAFSSLFSDEPLRSHTPPLSFISYFSIKFFGTTPHWRPHWNPGEACAHFTVVSCGMLPFRNQSASLKSITSRQTSQANRERRIFALLTLQEYYFQPIFTIFPQFFNHKQDVIVTKPHISILFDFKLFFDPSCVRCILSVRFSRVNFLIPFHRVSFLQRILSRESRSRPDNGISLNGHPRETGNRGWDL